MSEAAAVPELSVVIPAYNEATRLPPSVEKVLEYLRSSGRSYELIVVDDGSRDATVEKVEAMNRAGAGIRLVRHPVNLGKGAAVRTGVLASTGELVLFTDADLSTPIEELEKLQAALDGGAGVAIASRSIKGSRVEISQPFYRVLMGKTFNLMVQALLLPGIWDTQCGFKLFRADVARAVFAGLTTDRFGYDPEVLHRAKKQGVGIAEVPVVWRNSAPTKVSTFRSSLEMFKDVIRIRFKG